MQVDKSRKQVELERLRLEHRALDEQIMDIERRSYLSPGEEAEVKRLKVLKLHKKDEIAALARQANA
ncbi:MAG: YdcH family protein [Myxococcales bacterium]